MNNLSPLARDIIGILITIGIIGFVWRLVVGPFPYEGGDDDE